MSLRTQLSLLTAVSVAVAVVVVSLAAYFAARDRLLGQVDQSLHSRSMAIENGRGLPRLQGGGELEGVPRPRDAFGQADTFFQVINGGGSVVAAPPGQQGTIPVSSQDIAVANGAHGAYMRDVTSGELHMRVLTSPGQAGEAVQIARSLNEVDASLAELRNILLVVSGGGVLLAAIVGLIVAQRSLRPVARLTAAAEHVAETQNLEARIEVRRNDEIGRLATSFNEMLRALHESRQQQRQLVSDASHELRTPLTSLRTNIEVLARGDDMRDAERRELLRDVTFELEELTKVVTELVELASDARTEAQTHEDVRLDQLAASIVERFSRRSGLHIELEARPTLVVGNYGLLERAAGNLLDNACKWSPPGASVEVKVADGVLSVRDHGPGIADIDRSHVFDRFYRAEAARAKPGSGLGLAIVKQIVEAHDGTVTIEAAPDGGTIASIALPVIAMDDAPPPEPPAPPMADAPGVGAAPGGAS
ncbi:MAG: HAMP domain-containing histidine kinase [Dehalococcoidia bacterium]|nr:MAG: HAMP domain-containing histidine kinase [Dehalococcoidia bacterium]